MLRDRLQTAFGEHGHRCRNAANRIAGERRRNRYDASAGLLRQHLLNDALGEVQKTLDIRGDERLEIVGRVVGERLRKEDPGVIDEGVNLLKSRQCGLDDFGGRRRLANVAVHESDALRCRDLGGLGDLARSRDDVKAALNKPCDDPRPDSLRSASDDSRLSWPIHVSSPRKLSFSLFLETNRNHLLPVGVSALETERVIGTYWRGRNLQVPYCGTCS